jgi:hypothetical protein
MANLRSFPLQTPGKVQELICDLVTITLPRGGISLDDIQILVPVHKGVGGRVALNSALRERFGGPKQSAASAIGSFKRRMITTETFSTASWASSRRLMKMALSFHSRKDRIKETGALKNPHFPSASMALRNFSMGECDHDA